MRRVRNKKTLCLAAAALILTCSAASGKALAYFTDYVSASGNAPVSMGFTDTEIEEKVSNWTKTVTVKNTGDYACFVRVRAFAQGDRALEYTSDGDGWMNGEDGYYYYKVPVAPKGITEDPLKIRIERPGDEETEDIKVIVVEEHALLFYNEEGMPDLSLSWKSPSRTETENGESKEGTDG